MHTILIFIMSLTFHYSVAGTEIPEISKENIKWMIPADEWAEVEIYKLKKFIQFKTDRKIVLYSDIGTTKQFQTLYSGFAPTLINENKQSCSVPKTSYELTKEDVNYVCGYRFCDYVKTGYKVTKFPESLPVLEYEEKNVQLQS